MMTLTIRYDFESLEQGIAHLATSFRKLRQSPNWKKRVLGGIYVIEITKGSTGESWHPHLHILFDGTFYPQGELANDWETASGGSRICWLNAIRNRRNSARYAAKYAAKPASLKTWDAESIVEYAEAVHGKRMCHTFGRCHGKVVDPGDDADDRHLTNYRLFKEHWAEWFANGSSEAQLMLRVAALISHETARAFDVTPAPIPERGTDNARMTLRAFAQLIRETVDPTANAPPDTDNGGGGNHRKVQTQLAYADAPNATRRNAQLHGM